LLSIEPIAVGSNSTSSEQAAGTRWALMQKTPASGQGGSGGEWFTSSVDPRESEGMVERMMNEGKDVKGGLLEALAAKGDQFGELGRIGSGDVKGDD
jgi:hypothetical protein